MSIALLPGLGTSYTPMWLEHSICSKRAAGFGALTSKDDDFTTFRLTKYMAVSVPLVTLRKRPLTRRIHLTQRAKRAATFWCVRIIARMAWIRSSQIARTTTGL